MKFQEIKNNIFYCGLNDCDRRIFDELEYAVSVAENRAENKVRITIAII